MENERVNDIYKEIAILLSLIGIAILSGLRYPIEGADYDCCLYVEGDHIAEEQEVNDKSGNL